MNKSRWPGWVNGVSRDDAVKAIAAIMSAGPRNRDSLSAIITEEPGKEVFAATPELLKSKEAPSEPKSGTLSTTSRDERSFSRILPRYLEQLRAEGKSARTINSYEERINYFLNFAEEHGYPSSIDILTPDVVREYARTMQTTVKYHGHPHIPEQTDLLSPKTIEGRVKSLKILSSSLCKEGYFEKDPLASVKPPKVPMMLPNPLSKEEIAHVLDSIDREISPGDRNYVIVVFLLDTGLRASELTGLKFKNVDMEKRQLRFFGKGAKERVVPFGHSAKNQLQDYINRIRPKGHQGPDDYVFFGTNGKPLTANALKLMFTRLRKKTGIPNLHAHILRDTFAVNYLLNGGDIGTLQRILGHADLNTVRLYLNFTQEQIASQHSRFSPMDNFELP